MIAVHAVPSDPSITSSASPPVCGLPLNSMKPSTPKNPIVTKAARTLVVRSFVSISRLRAESRSFAAICSR